MSPAAGSWRQCFHLENFGGLKGMEKGMEKGKEWEVAKFSFGALYIQ